MKTVVYDSPFVPAEWIAAHGLLPRRILASRSKDTRILGPRDGVCPYAQAFLETAVASSSAAMIFATTCDQMRRASEWASSISQIPVFLIHVPTTWQTLAARKTYMMELERLGRFLVSLGGEPPAPGKLASVMRQYDAARASLRAARGHLSPRQYSEAIVHFHGFGVERVERVERGSVVKVESPSPCPLPQERGVELGDTGTALNRPSLIGDISANNLRIEPLISICHKADEDIPSPGGEGQGEGNSQFPTLSLSTLHAPPAPPAPRPIPLALVGGPLLKEHFDIFNVIESAGGRVVLDATTSGERSLPAPFDGRALDENPFLALVDAYFGFIPDAFQRPNSQLYVWLQQQFVERGVEGILFRYYVWCDTWHAEAQRMKEWTHLPFLAIETGDDDHLNGHATSRIHAFMEMLTNNSRAKASALHP